MSKDKVNRDMLLISTARFLEEQGLACGFIAKVGEGEPDIGQAIESGLVRMVINTPLGEKSRFDESAIRRGARGRGIPCITTLSGARAAVDGICSLRRGLNGVVSLQELAAKA